MYLWSKIEKFERSLYHAYITLIQFAYLGDEPWATQFQRALHRPFTIRE